MGPELEKGGDRDKGRSCDLIGDGTSTGRIVVQAQHLGR
jgi:hypothetical protein